MNNIISIKKIATLAFAVLFIAIALFVVVPQVFDLDFGFGAATAEACCGDGDGGGGTPCELYGQCDPPVVVYPATCDAFTASPTTLPHGGGNVTLVWATSNAQSVSIDQGIGAVAADGSKIVFVGSTKTFKLLVNGQSGGDILGGSNTDSCVVTVTVAPPVTHIAVCDFFTASPTSLPHGGGNTTLSWGTTNATSVSINQGVGTVAVDGSKSVFVGSSKTFTLTAVGTGGNDSCAVTVTVLPATPVASCDFFTASPTSLPHGGGNVTLNWGTTNANSVSINQAVGTVAVDGSKVVFVGSSKTFTLTAVGTGGNDSCAVTVTVAQIGAPSCDAFTGNPTSLPFGGGNVTLNWATTNATNVSINQGIGSVNADGSTSVFVGSSKTFVLTASNVQGSVDCSVSVNVGQNQVFTCDYFNIDKSRVEKGESFTLSWGTTNADSVSINNGIGNVNLDGSHTTSVQDNTTFVLTARKGNDSVTCSRSVDIESDNGGGSPSPRCELEISDKKVKKGEKVTLSWETSNATDITIKDNHGNTILDTDDLSSKDKKEFMDGEIKVTPTKDTTYTLNAERGSKDRTCKVSVDVENEITVLEVRDQKPLVAGIALTQVPYTGFEAGPMLTLIFYGLLAFWALFIAYVLVIKKKHS